MPSSTNIQADIVIIGAGIVGLATARELQRQQPQARIVVIDKEDGVSRHQTGRNSGVIHAGVYYPPGSLKAQFCRQGLAATIAFCQEHGIAYQQCGKLLVATNSRELAQMEQLYQRCQNNQLTVEKLTATQLRQREPHIEGLAALWIKDTGIVDYPAICKKMAALYQQGGGRLLLATQLHQLEETSDAIVAHTNRGLIRAKYLVNCAGLQADRITAMLGIETDFQIIPFRGEYYQLAAKHNHLINHLIYPIPDPELPFLGIHLTRMIDGSITVGPNAVLGWHREGYGRFNLSRKDSWQMLRFSGFWRLLSRNLRAGILELKNSYSKRSYLKQVQRYCPQLRLDDLQPYPVGIRAQAVNRKGELIHDFLFAQSSRSLHVCNAPSPAATSAIPIGKHISDKVLTAMTDQHS